MGKQKRGRHSIETLKELFEEKLSAIQGQITARDKALKLQDVEYKRRLGELNHEHSRVATAQQTYVSKDTWDGFIKSDLLWKSSADRAIQAAVPRSEFQEYKDTTETALALKTGQSQGVSMTTGAIVILITVLLSAAGLAVAILTRH